MSKSKRAWRPMRFYTAAAAGLLALAATALAAEPADPYLWLEEVEGERALDWVRARNAETLAVLEAVPEFAPMREEALEILTSEARIPAGQVHGGAVYNFWQDATHVRGIWRRASLESYRRGAPSWETVLDYDALALEEGRNWVRGAVVCLEPAYERCMVELSDGGKDAGYWREFNTRTKSFVEGGFSLPEGKSNVDWLDEDQLLVGYDSGEGSLTTSGYPRTAVKWARGTAISEAATLIEGETSDVSAGAFAETDGAETWVFGYRSPSFFERIYFLQDPDGSFEPAPWPRNIGFDGVIDGRAILVLREDWSHAGRDFRSGDVVAFDLDRGEAELVFSPAANQSVEEVEVAGSAIVVQYLEDVSGKAMRLVRDRKQEKWNATPIALPANGVVSIVSAGGGTDDVILSFESLTDPDALYYVEGRGGYRPGATAKTRKFMQLPAFYDASEVVVEQRFATSADGTKVPYFIMARKEVLDAGDAPTVQYAYGGFLSPTLPVYYSDPGRPQHGALAGRMWVARGGVLVLSNIRGGSEYGPAWHQAALKENRQRAFDDFIAISEDLIATGVTTPARLGAIGRSNGGLLMGAIMTQRPDLYAAIDIGVPLLDMMRYHRLLAGASWMGEYGDPDNPEERAYLAAYSPYQKLAGDRPYPRPFFYTSTKDDRVHPGHARKAAAKLIDLGHDVFYYENIEGGHGGAANQDQLAYRTALEFAYFSERLMGAAGEPEVDKTTGEADE